ncbi:MAG: hypothetical protein AVDCRST_MAG20-1212, partial [uncultured Acidimicrobiales bacterium]
VGGGRGGSRQHAGRRDGLPRPPVLRRPPPAQPLRDLHGDRRRLRRRPHRGRFRRGRGGGFSLRRGAALGLRRARRPRAGLLGERRGRGPPPRRRRAPHRRPAPARRAPLRRHRPHGGGATGAGPV